MPTWEPDFDVYFALVDDAPASFMVDLAAEPVDTHDTRLQVRVTMKNPREDGMRDEAELEPLGELEDALVEWLEQTYDAIYVGHMISEGALHLVVYAPAERVGEPTDLLDGFDPADYELGWLIEPDAEWSMFAEFLYPDPYAMQVIQNRRLLQARAEHGDDPSLVHAVDHAAFFETREHAEAASEALQALGFAIDGLERDEQEAGWLLSFQRDDSLDGERPDQFCIEILEALEPHEGAYSGWGAAILRSAQTTH